MTVIKRSRADSSVDLIAALKELIPLLRDQKETDAADDLDAVVKSLKQAAPGSADHKKAIDQVIDAFEGDHELMAYTLQRESSAGQWTEVERLALASSRVISLARRMI